MKRGGPLARRTPLNRSAGHRALDPNPLNRTGSLPRKGKPTKARHTPKSWVAARAKVDAEGCCRWCRTRERRLQAAHIIGQRYDGPNPNGPGKWVDPDHVVPLCAECHRAYDAHAINLRGRLTPDEWEAACLLVGPGQAERRVMGSAWRST